MSVPLPEDLPAPRRPVPAHQGANTPDSPRERVKLARKWAYLISTTAYIPLAHAEVEQRLSGLVDILVDTIRAEPFVAAPVEAVGAELVKLNCVGPESLERTIDVLGRSLLGLPVLRRVDRLTDRVVMVIASLTAGYLEAFRAFIFQQQEALNRALFKAANDAERQRKDSDARLEEVFRCSASGIAITDLDGRFQQTNAAVSEMLGYSADELAGLSLFELVAEDGRKALRKACQDLVEGKVSRLRQQRKLMVTKDEDPCWALLSISLQPGEDGAPGRLVTVIADDTQVTSLQEMLNHQSLHDRVTRLPNRQYFSTAIETMLRRADPERGVTLYHLDLDAFSSLNNGYGPEVGDRLLRTVADRLFLIFEEEETIIARLAGDEFAVLVRNSATTPSVLTMTRRIEDELSEPIYLEDGTTGIAVSVTIAVVDRPRLSVSPVELMRAADLTLRRVKRTGRRQWDLYDVRQDTEDRDFYRVAAAMAGAWENGEVQVRHRPVVRLDTRELAGLEGLLHWPSKDYGELGHERCVALADSTGLMVKLGEWLLIAAARNRKRAQQAGSEAPLVLSLTPNQCVDPDLTSMVHKVTQESGLPYEQLRLGFPVGALQHRMAVDNLADLADNGVHVTLDAFGSAAGDVLLLTDLPVSTVRVAPALVARQAEQPTSLVAKALADLVGTARMAGATVLVDGVHTDAQADWWRAVGAEYAVGALFDAAEDISPN